MNRIRQYASSRPQAHAESATIFSGHRLLQRKRACGASDQIGERAEYPNKGFPSQPRVTNSDAESRNDCFVPPIVHEVVRSPGRPLDPATRGFMEPRFGHDFSHVRIHTDGKAAESARTLSARAYTVGNAVVFGSGRFAPSTSAGRLLIAHELSHTIQQSSPEIPLTGELTTMPSGHPTERQADAAAQLVSAGGSAEYLFQGHTRTFSSGKTPALQLQPEAKAPAPAPKSFREKLDGFIAQKNALRSQLDTNARSLQFMTTVVGIYSNDVFKQWEPWRKGILKIGDAALSLKQEIEKTIVRSYMPRRSCRGAPNAQPRQCFVGQAERLGSSTSSSTSALTELPENIQMGLESPSVGLQQGARRALEPRLGYDFSKVRIHHDSRANRSADSLNARACTLGADIVFGPGQFAPTKQAGLELLAHELTHVIQNNARYFEPGNNLRPLSRQDAAETEANHVEANLFNVGRTSIAGQSAI